MPLNLFISAGEASGEHYGALLIDALKKQLAARGQSARFFGMGGSRMADAGLEIVVRSEDMAVMGVTEIVRHLPRIYREFRKLKEAIQTRKPDIAVLIDFPDIHFKLAEELHRLNIPVIFFVSPQLWAWKKHRIKLVRKYVRRMLVIFPFEEGFYREHGVEAEFVGHPLAELPLPTISREQFATENGLHLDRTWVGILPGSRAKEIRDNLPEMLEAAWTLSLPVPGATYPAETYDFVIPVAPTLSAEQRAEVYQQAEDRAGGLCVHGLGMFSGGFGGLCVRVVEDARAALFHCRASIVASGTATVEAALIGNPFVVVYRVSPITYAVAKRFVKVPHIAMANLIAGKRVVPELIQHNFTAPKIVQQLESLLPEGAPRQSMMKELEAIGKALNSRPEGGEHDGLTAIERVAAITLKELNAASLANASNAAHS